MVVDDHVANSNDSAELGLRCQIHEQRYRKSAFNETYYCNEAAI
jgi:hypothetical protein